MTPTNIEKLKKLARDAILGRLGALDAYKKERNKLTPVGAHYLFAALEAKDAEIERQRGEKDRANEALDSAGRQLYALDADMFRKNTALEAAEAALKEAREGLKEIRDGTRADMRVWIDIGNGERAAGPSIRDFADTLLPDEEIHP